MTYLALEVREPISVSAAEPGWRALYVNPANNTQHFADPVVAWAVYELRLQDSDSGDQLPKVRRVIEGAVRSGTELISASDNFDGFWGYLTPDEPTPEEGTPWPPEDMKGKGKRREGEFRGKGQPPGFKR
jgi:hypothetical protein